MSQNKARRSGSNHKTQITQDGTVEVLYQKMGDRWFAFSLIDDEVFVGSISQEEIDVLESGANPRAKKLHPISGNS